MGAPNGLVLTGEEGGVKALREQTSLAVTLGGCLLKLGPRLKTARL